MSKEERSKISNICFHFRKLKETAGEVKRKEEKGKRKEEGNEEKVEKEDRKEEGKVKRKRVEESK